MEYKAESFEIFNVSHDFSNNMFISGQIDLPRIDLLVLLEKKNGCEIKSQSKDNFGHSSLLEIVDQGG